MAIGGVPYYPSYPMQMFDRKLKALSTLYVGLVATKRQLTDEIREAFLANSDHLNRESANYKNLEDEKHKTFYTFKFVCFSDHAALQGSIDTKMRDKWRSAEYPGKTQRPVHQSDVTEGSLSFDPYEPASLSEYRGMVGAWKIGKVMDTAARRKDVYNGGPIDTAEQLTVNVCIEWCDWRKLRRLTNREDIGGYVSGAPMWLNSLNAKLKRVKGGNIEKDDKTEIGFFVVDDDDGRIFQWPSDYVERGSSSKERMDKDVDLAAQKANAPMNVDQTVDKTPTEIETEFTKYIQAAKVAMNYTKANPLGIQARIKLIRAEGAKQGNYEILNKEEVTELFNAIAGAGAVGFRPRDFTKWASNAISEYQTSDATDKIKQFVNAIWGFFNGFDLPTPSVISRPVNGAISKIITSTVENMAYFTDGKQVSYPLFITKEMFTGFLDASSKSTADLTTPEVNSIGANMQNAVDLLIAHEVDMRGDDTGITERETEQPTKTSNGKRKKTIAGKVGVVDSSASTSSATSAPEPMDTADMTSAFPAAVSKPSAKPAAKAVTAGTPAATPVGTPAAPASSDIFSAIFGTSGTSGSGDTDKSPSGGNPRGRVRRARDGR